MDIVGSLRMWATVLLVLPAAAWAQNGQLPPGVTAAESAAHRLQLERDQQEHPTLSIGAPLPAFNLKGVDGRMHTPAEYRASRVLVVMFICNHCPASQNYEARIKALVNEFTPQGAQFIAIEPNGPQAMSPREMNYTDVDDSFESMIERARFRHFNFPYLYDGDTQSVANAFGPKVTPHLFVFDAQRRLRFEGRIDDAMIASHAHHHEAHDAIAALLAGRAVPVAHTPVFGCSTKWNNETEGKERELREWQAQPVTLKTATPQVLRDLRRNPTGKLLLINFWATWCGPCQVEYPELLQSYLWYRSRDFEFISVSVDAPSSRAAVMHFLQEQHSAVQNYQVDSDDVYAIQAAFDPKWQSGVPFTLLLAPDGHEIYRHEGETNTLTLRRIILANLPDGGLFAGNPQYWAQATQ